MNPRLDALHPYPFEKLRALLASAGTPPDGLAPINLSIGEPKHAAPERVAQAIRDGMAGLSVYPSTKGDPALRRAISAWLARRYSIPAPDAETQVLPALGSREALFAFTQTRSRRRDAAGRRHTLLRQCRRGAQFRLRLEPGAGRHLAQDAAGVRLLARQPGRQRDVAGRVEDAVPAVRPPRFRHRVRRMLFRDLRTKAIRRWADCRPRAAWAATTTATGGVLQPVQALQRARPALGLRGRGRGADRPLPAVPHVSWQRHEPHCRPAASPPGPTRNT